MVKFIGDYNAKLDDKGRLVFPVAFKELCLDQGTKPVFVVKKNLFSKCLEMYLYSEWEAESDSVRSKLNPFNVEHDIFWRAYLQNRALVSPDEKIGRITIPKELLEQIGVKKDVVFCGKDYKIEVWSKEEYAKTFLSEEDFVKLAEKILR
ncbi:MAG: hypothetical protein J6Z27_01625 [Bacteroidales bacterium]|nr:hypothetical protein [Bacteroidales bacterium]